MKRDVDFSAISNGRLYQHKDMVRCDSNGCKSCTHCCTDMEGTVLLDPYDVYCLCTGLHTSFDELLTKHIELQPSEGLILPYMKYNDAGTCSFLNAAGRCEIHDFRPGFCRLFPLGRIYHEDTRSFSYFMQEYECPCENKSKVKIEKWLGIERLSLYERYICNWHYLSVELTELLRTNSDEAFAKNLCMAVLNLFYRRHYTGDFYEEIEHRITTLRKIIS